MKKYINEKIIMYILNKDMKKKVNMGIGKIKRISKNY